MSVLHRDQWKRQMKNDYPNVPDYLIDYCLDIHNQNPDFFKNLNKKMKHIPKKSGSGFSRPPTTTEIKGIEFITPQQELEMNKDGIIQPIKVKF
jgi:hypothetical protein